MEVPEQSPQAETQQVKPKKKRVMSQYDKEYNNSERGRAAQEKFRESNRELCSSTSEKARISRMLTKYETMLSQIIPETNLYKKTLEIVNNYKKKDVENDKKIEELRVKLPSKSKSSDKKKK